MKNFYVIFFILILPFCTNLKEEKPDRISFIQSFDPENTLYIFDSEKDYVKHGAFEKDEKIIYSGKYSYKWANQDKNNYIDLTQFIPNPDANGYRDLSKYDSLYINIYSKEKTSSTFIMAISCQKIGNDNNAYYYYYITMNFKGWKELKISFSEFTDNNYMPDLTKVTHFYFNSKGWNQIVDPTSVIYIDKFFFTKAKYEFNMDENDINGDTYSTIINRMKYIMTYNTIDNTKSKIVLDRVNALVREANNNYLKMNKNGLPFNYSMTKTSDMSSIYSLIRSMAIGYASEGGQLYKDSKLLENITRALDYMNENYYNKREKNLFSNNNWWDWEIGSAEKLIDTLICISDDIPQKLLDKYLEPINRYDPLPSMTMSNRMNIAYSSIFSSVLQKNYKRISISIEMLRECFDTVEKSDGFYDDGSFIQHGYYAYIGGYGDEMITALSIITYSLDESVFRLDDKMKNFQYYWIINSYLPSMYNGGYMDLFRGRTISRDIKGDQSGKFVINTLCLMIDYLNNEESINYLKSILKDIYQISKPYLRYVLTPASLIKLEEFENDENIKPKKINNFAKIFSRVDRAVSQINNIGLGISMSSTRNGKYESINSENTKGWYSGDGMTYIYLDVNDYASDYWPKINPYRLQGTTVTKAKREEKQFSGLDSLASFDFVGGAYNNLNMVAAMQFGSKSESVGFNSTLVGNKAYFVFEGQLICLGNSINCKDDYDVETIVENRNLSGKFYFGDKEIKDKFGNVNNKNIYIENYGAIYLPDYNKVKFNINNNFLEIYFNHGKKIENEEYSYMIFPKIEKSEIKDKINNIEILENSELVSAVKNKKLNIIEYVFWKSGKYKDIKVDNPCILIIENDYIYVSEPTQKLNYITISIGNDNYQVRVEKGYTSKIKKYK